MRKLVWLFLFFCCSVVSAQEEQKSWWKEHAEFNGYLKYLHSANFVTLDQLSTTNLLHNRLNFKVDAKDFRLSVGMRNRVFYGDQVVYTPGFEEALELDNGYADMSFVWGRSPTVMAHTVFDRLNLKWVRKDLEVTVGRQRINWGINLAWNANDLFNTYNFVDFDYEERPGNDAIRVLHYLKGGMSSVEVAYKPGRTADETIAAARYVMNTRGYDIQFLSGWYYEDVALGAGWAGNIKKLGFKGEATAFLPREEMNDVVFTGSSSVDYSFDNGLYFNGSMLYNSGGIKDAAQLDLLSAGQTFGNITAKQLMPTVWSLFVQGSYAPTPLLNTSLAAIYGSEINLLFLMPSVSYSVATQWDVSLVGQLYFAEYQEQFGAAGSSVFLRLKWSF